MLALKIQVGGRPLLVYNIYRSQRHELEAGELLTLASHVSLLVAGDFNAHHPMLQSPSPANETGRHLAVLLEDVPHIRLLNTGEAIHTRGGGLTSLWCRATWFPALPGRCTLRSPATTSLPLPPSQ